MTLGPAARRRLAPLLAAMLGEPADIAADVAAFFASYLGRAPLLAAVGLAEKGVLDCELVTTDPGGHASSPTPGGSHRRSGADDPPSAGGGLQLQVPRVQTP